MQRQNSKVINFLKTDLKQNSVFKPKRQLSCFNKKLYSILQSDINSIKMQQVYNMKSIKEFAKANKCKNVYLLAAVQGHNHCVILTSIENKSKLACIGYYKYEKVRIEQILEDNNPVFILYVDEADKNKILELKEKRYSIKQNSCVDRNSIFYRHRERYGSKDKSGYCNHINKLYEKIGSKFLTQDFDKFLQYVSNIEISLIKQFQYERNRLYNISNKELYTFSSSIPSFEYPIKYIHRALNNLNNIDAYYLKYYSDCKNSEESCKKYIKNENLREFYRSFVEIKETELNFRQNIMRFVSENLNR